MEALLDSFLHIRIKVSTKNLSSNVSRLARSAGYEVNAEEKEGEYLLKLVKS